MSPFDPRPPSSTERGPTGAPLLPTDRGPGPPPGEPVLPEPASPDQLPPDPEAYDSPRAAQARARGLSAPYIAGGHDPDPEGARREERRLGILLVVMIVVVVSLGFVLGIIQNLLGL